MGTIVHYSKKCNEKRMKVCSADNNFRLAADIFRLNRCTNISFHRLPMYVFVYDQNLNPIWFLRGYIQFEETEARFNAGYKLFLCFYFDSLSKRFKNNWSAMGCWVVINIIFILFHLFSFIQS